MGWRIQNYEQLYCSRDGTCLSDLTLSADDGYSIQIRGVDGPALSCVFGHLPEEYYFPHLGKFEHYEYLDTNFGSIRVGITDSGWDETIKIFVLCEESELLGNTQIYTQYVLKGGNTISIRAPKGYDDTKMDEIFNVLKGIEEL